MAASQYHFNTINREYLVLKSYNRISLETFSIQFFFFKTLYHLNGKSKRNFLNIIVYGVFLLTFFFMFWKTKEIVQAGVRIPISFAQ